MKIISVVGARPNFIKIAPFVKEIGDYNKATNSNLQSILLHTGQHYDIRMSDHFFSDLGIPIPDINLGVGSGTHAEQVGYTMIAFEKVLKQEKPDWVVVVGDVNATLACSVTAKKEGVKCCHIEAGLRSYDMSMPEEINRLVTDRLCDLLLTPDILSGENLRKEGVPEERIVFVGNIMIDTLNANIGKAVNINLNDVILTNEITQSGTRLIDDQFAIMTIHRPSNVDNKTVLSSLITFLVDEVCPELPLVWTIHPRTLKNLEQFGLLTPIKSAKNLILLNPLRYHEMLRLNMSARLMLTDSGGLQEECTIIGTPCLTLRWNTERPITLKEFGGASVLVGNNIDHIRTEYQIAQHLPRIPIRPDLWDGHTAKRCLRAILNSS